MRKPFQRRDTGIWYYQYPSGKQVPLGKTEPWPKKKKEMPKEIETAWHALKVVRKEPKDTALKDVVEEYRAHVAGMGEGTRKKARLWMGWLMTHIGENKKVSKLQPVDLTRFLRTRNWGPSMKRGFLTKVMAMMNHAVGEGMIDANPFKGYKKPRELRRKIVLSPDTIRQIEEAAEARFRSFLIGLKESGCRPIELTRARIEHCDLAEGILLVPNKTQDATGEAWRPIYLSPGMKALIERLVAKRTNGFIFRNQNDDQWTVDALDHRMAVVRRKLKSPVEMALELEHDEAEVAKLRSRITEIEKVTLYALRHTFCSNALNKKNINPAILARLMGHVDVRQLRIYFHEDMDAMRDAIQKIGGEVE